MKRVLSFLFALVLTLAIFAVPASADDITALNVCYRKPVTSSTRMQINEIYPLNLTDGNYSLRASSYTMDVDNPYEWFRIDLGADYTISEIVLSVTANMSPKSIAIDVWSAGEWVRVVQDYDIKTEDYPKVYYFDEIDASYIQLSINELPNVPADAAAVELYSFSLAEVEAYHTEGISEREKKASFEKTPEGSPVIPVPEAVNELFFKQGARSDAKVCQQIPEEDLTSFMGQFAAFRYYDADINYLKSIYKDNSEKLNWISTAKVAFCSAKSSSSDIQKAILSRSYGSEILNLTSKAKVVSSSAKSSSLYIQKAAINQDYYYETAIDWNPILLYCGIALITIGIIGIIITLIFTFRKKKKNK